MLFGLEISAFFPLNVEETDVMDLLAWEWGNYGPGAHAAGEGSPDLLCPALHLLLSPPPEAQVTIRATWAEGHICRCCGWSSVCRWDPGRDCSNIHKHV